MPRTDELTKQQHIDLMKAYREVAPTCMKQEEAWRKTNAHPAPRYYITPRQAWDRMRRMAVGDFEKVDKMKPARKRMFYSLFGRLNEMSQRTEFIGCSLWFICQFLVLEPAPEFFLSNDAVKKIFLNTKKYGPDFRYYKIKKRRDGSSD